MPGETIPCIASTVLVPHRIKHISPKAGGKQQLHSFPYIVANQVNAVFLQVFKFVICPQWQFKVLSDLEYHSC